MNRTAMREHADSVQGLNNSFYGRPSEILIGGNPLPMEYWQKAFSADKGESPGDNT
jgi:hypothetical protein